MTLRKLGLPTTQRGIALITVMLVLAVVTVSLVSMSSDRQMDIRRTENQLRSSQAWEYVHGLEAWAENQLNVDFATNQYDALTDRWSKPLFSTIPEGNVKADIIELQGRINLNNLLVDDQASDEDVQRLKRLLTHLNIKPELVDAMLDWMDADMEMRHPNGAEDEIYTKLVPAYRSANSPFAEVSELLRVQGITQTDYQKLLPYIYVAEGYQPVNVNTASAVVLRCIAKDIKKDEAESIFRASGKPFEKVEEFLKDEAMAGISVNKAGLSVVSNHFLLSGQIDMGKNGLTFQSQIQRSSDGTVKVSKRMRRSLLDG